MLKVIVTNRLQVVTFWFYKKYNPIFQQKIFLQSSEVRVFNGIFGERLLYFRKLSTVLTPWNAKEKVSNTFKKTAVSFNVTLSD